jgi:peptidoglycan hydrolase CwlO-like protein
VSDSTIVEILLGVLALVVGYSSYIGASRASTATSMATQADVDAEAYARAKSIYESAIDALEGHVSRLQKQIDILGGEITKLQQSNLDLQRSNLDLQGSNAELRSQVLELQMANTRLESELKSFKEANGHE